MARRLQLPRRTFEAIANGIVAPRLEMLYLSPPSLFLPHTELDLEAVVPPNNRLISCLRDLEVPVDALYSIVAFLEAPNLENLHLGVTGNGAGGLDRDHRAGNRRYGSSSDAPSDPTHILQRHRWLAKLFVSAKDQFGSLAFRRRSRVGLRFSIFLPIHCWMVWEDKITVPLFIP